jgi:hypothetical protein
MAGTKYLAPADTASGGTTPNLPCGCETKRLDDLLVDATIVRINFSPISVVPALLSETKLVSLGLQQQPNVSE